MMSGTLPVGAQYLVTERRFRTSAPRGRAMRVPLNHQTGKDL